MDSDWLPEIILLTCTIQSENFLAEQINNSTLKFVNDTNLTDQIKIAKFL